jgi:ABC-type bacteriocin/lantibiotic exporter with double-glycine peptidase domain
MPLYIMVTLLVIEAMLAAATTYLVIQASRDVASNEFRVLDLVWIFVSQSSSYAVGAVSWVFAERAGFRAYSQFILRFARDNRHESKLLHDRAAREQTEPFLTNETFQTIFRLMYEVEAQLKLALALIFNAAVLGSEIDGSLPLAYLAVFLVLTIIQFSVQKRIAAIYLENQRQNNRVTAHGYTAWDNIFSGNKYNLRLWIGGFKGKVRDCLRAQIRAIVAREGMSAVGGILGLCIVFVTMSFIALREAGDVGVLIALAATLPKQIEMTNGVHQLASDWNDVIAAWTRLGGIAANAHPEPDPGFSSRIKFDRLVLREGDEVKVCHDVDDAMRLVFSERTGRINVRGGNGSGKSTLLAGLKAEIKNRGYYWPTSDRLAFRFAAASDDAAIDLDDGPDGKSRRRKKKGFSSGERQLKSLQEIVSHTDAPVYLLDEWDANLDAANRAAADELVSTLASRARVIEISHRDRA